MSYYITDDCINCDACRGECPDNAIYRDNESYELNGKRYEPLNYSFYFIVPDKCRSCSGSVKIPKCLMICPMNSIKFNNNINHQFF